ncbi:hypothetical protein ABID22_003873 [Pontibacter aydingkolensis]|uniref:SWFGD domain-containing protein n=1 Tax=Pontibacter aydingkolensis TaxID=1911536 RepID=A0ABS7CZB8_9BACT|nr:hypothetical protein [Pontibacter aydingkolensis]MBW7469157.1 hypothetical protein [Pontibacter aydingkolensis]
MNRNFENENRQRKSAYADFDEYGNPLTGNTNSLSRYTPQSKYGSFGRNTQSQVRGQKQQSSNSAATDRQTNASHAYGDMSHGTRYGEGGSYEGGGSGYGHSYYSMRGSEGPGFSRQEGNWSESRQYGMGDYDKFMNRNYGYFGRSSGGGYTGEDSRRPGQGTGSDYINERYYNEPYEGSYRESSGYDRGYSGFGDTGYGATRYNMRDQDRERSANSNRSFRNEQRNYSDRNYDDRNRNRFNPDMDW